MQYLSSKIGEKTALTGRRAHVIDSAARPMAGRPLHAAEGFKQPQAAALAFKARWAELVAAGEPFLCWTSSQKGEFANSAQQLAALHRLRCPGALVDVLDSTTPELAAEVAADPDGWAERRAAEAQALGVSWALLMLWLVILCPAKNLSRSTK